MTDIVSIALVQGCLLLMNISHDNCDTTYEGILALAQECPELVKLEIDDSLPWDMDFLSSEVRFHIWWYKDWRYISACAGLSCTRLWSCQNISDADGIAIGLGCFQLRVINITDNDVINQGQGCPPLQSIDLSNCKLITELSALVHGYHLIHNNWCFYISTCSRIPSTLKLRFRRLGDRYICGFICCGTWMSIARLH